MDALSPVLHGLRPPAHAAQHAVIANAIDGQNAVDVMQHNILLASMLLYAGVVGRLVRATAAEPRRESGPDQFVIVSILSHFRPTSYSFRRGKWFRKHGLSSKGVHAAA